MLLSLARLVKYGWNQRSLEMPDFYAICEAERIAVLEDSTLANSFYLSLLGSRYIMIGKTESELHKRYIALHELAHALLSGGQSVAVLFHGLTDTKDEKQCDAFAAIGIVPRAVLTDPNPFLETCCCGYAAKIYKQRMKIYQTYGI